MVVVAIHTGFLYAIIVMGGGFIHTVEVPFSLDPNEHLVDLLTEYQSVVPECGIH